MTLSMGLRYTSDRNEPIICTVIKLVVFFKYRVVFIAVDGAQAPKHSGDTLQMCVYQVLTRLVATEKASYFANTSYISPTFYFRDVSFESPVRRYIFVVHCLLRCHFVQSGRCLLGLRRNLLLASPRLKEPVTLFRM